MSGLRREKVSVFKREEMRPAQAGGGGKKNPIKKKAKRNTGQGGTPVQRVVTRGRIKGKGAGHEEKGRKKEVMGNGTRGRESRTKKIRQGLNLYYSRKKKTSERPWEKKVERIQTRCRVSACEAGGLKTKWGTRERLVR